jgi:hypothetical protein
VVLIAVTVTVWAEPMVDGAVYNPVLEIAPVAAGVMLQFTVVLPRPVPEAVNCCVCELYRVTEVGEIEIGSAYLKFTGTKRWPPRFGITE